MLRQVKILRGVPGCGKSTYIETLRTTHPDMLVWSFSADRYFIDKSGAYIFDAKKLGTAHGGCLRMFLDVLTSPKSVNELLVVDNTNTTVREMSTYVDLCKAHEIPFEIITIDTPPEIAAYRNVHGVPVEKVYQMHKRLINAQIPADWPHVVVPGVIV